MIRSRFAIDSFLCSPTGGGIELKPIPGRAAPAALSMARLRQMREFASQFTPLYDRREPFTEFTFQPGQGVNPPDSVPEFRTERGFSSTATATAISVPSVPLHVANTHGGLHITLSQDSEEKPYE